MIKDTHKEGYERYCLYLDTLSDIVKEKKKVTYKTLCDVFNDCVDVEGEDKTNLINQVKRETCDFANTLMTALGKNKIDKDVMNLCLENKEYIYKTFFKVEFEPLVDVIER